MNKKNNNGKTFGDIFSDISDKSNKNDDSSMPISFNNVNKKSENLKLGDLFSQVNLIDNQEDEALKDNEFVVSDSNDSKSFGDIFNNDIGNEKVDSNIDKTEEVNINDEKNEVDTDNKSFGNIFNNSNIEDEKLDSDVDKTEEVNINDEKNEVEADNKGFGNIFIDSNVEDEKLDSNINEAEEVNVDDEKSEFEADNRGFGNIFINSNVEDEKFDSDVDKTEEVNVVDEKSEVDTDNKGFGNIFNNSNIEDEKVDSNIDEAKEVNVDDKDELNKFSNEDNPFFVDLPDSVTSNEVSSSDNIKVDDNPFFKKEVVSDNSIYGKDTAKDNPFFQDDSINNDGIVENPFLSEKINLVENPSYNEKEISDKIDTTNVQNFHVKVQKKKEPLLKFILGVLSYAMFIWLLLIGLTLLLYVLDIKIRAAKGDMSPPKYNAYVVLTGSMLPEIQVYDVVVTKRVDVKSLKEGDVITFASSDTRFLNTVITHRIIKKNYDSKTDSYTFQTKGDNNNIADSALVNGDNVYGKVILKIPKLGYLQEFLATDGGWILVVLLPCLAVISYDIVKLSKGLRKKKYKNIKIQSR